MSWEDRMNFVMNAALEELANSFDEVMIKIGDRTLRSAVARSLDQKIAGMTGRTYAKWDAMTFVQDPPAAAWFHNKGVPQSTHVATFDSDGALVEQKTMAADDAQRFGFTPHAYAVETPGDMGDFDVNDRLTIIGACQPDLAGISPTH